MTQAALGLVVALIAHARHVPAVERERFALRLRRELANRGLILETCHRVEAYLVDEVDGEHMGLAASPPAGGQILAGDMAVRHAVAVAVGRDSVVVGEDQILHQLRTSVDAARAADALDPALERLFALALRAGRRARSWSHGPRRSLADVALSSIEQGGGPIRGRDVLVVGAGRMGRLAVAAAAAAGASVAVANRSADTAQALAVAIGGQHEPLDPGPAIGRFAGVIVALAGPWSISESTIEELVASPTVVVDLSVPAAVPAELARRLGSRLITADVLALAESEPTTEDDTVIRIEALIDQTAAEFLAWQKGRTGRAAAGALVERADREREAELAALWRRLPNLEPEARAAIDGMTRHLAMRLLREPLTRLGRATPDGRDETAVREIFAL